MVHPHLLSVIRRGVATIYLSSLAACGGNALVPDTMAEPTLVELRAAPLMTSIVGVTVAPAVSVYRNFQPITPPGGPPLIVSVRLPQSIAALSVDRVWVLFGDQLWSGTPQQNPGTLEWVSREGPLWGPGVNVEVVARLTAPGSASQLVRTANQPIKAVF